MDLLTPRRSPKVHYHYMHRSSALTGVLLGVSILSLTINCSWMHLGGEEGHQAYRHPSDASTPPQSDGKTCTAISEVRICNMLSASVNLLSK